jgi:nitrite reductase/ring-hydroxylating ferredoxin subunit
MAETHIPASDVPPGTMRAVDHDGARVAVCNVGGTCYAIQDRCPHRFANLSEGELDGDTVICPKHKGQFDLQTGEPRVWVAEPFLLHLLAKLVPKRHRNAKTYSVRSDGDDIVIE